MEFKFDIRRIFRTDSQGICMLLPTPNPKSKDLCEVIDAMGRESSRAQGLRSVITTSSRFFTSSDNKLYLKLEGSKVVGILKTGVRKLFYSNEFGKIIEMSPLCLLDFYIHEDFQRSGYGKELYEYMLRCESSFPNKIAIDRPSSKLVAFMRKHYGLIDFIPQNNNYVIYRQYFVENGQRREEAKAMRPNTQNPERREPEVMQERQLKAEGYERKTGLAQADRVLQRINNAREEETKQVYAPRPPWATTSKFAAPSTTSSQYGSHSFRK